jgi:exonuclease III
MSNTLRILTLNIWNYNDPWPKRRALITETIQKHQPDLIGFQEIRHSGEHDEDGKNQAQQLAECLPDYT